MEGSLTENRLIEYVIEFNMLGKITRVNNNLSLLTGLSKDELARKTICDIFPEVCIDMQKGNEFWNDMKLGKRRDELVWLHTGTDLFCLKSSFVPVKFNGSIEKVICYAINLPDKSEKGNEGMADTQKISLIN